ncbi:unnamed protein product [Cylicocyclus nassatus]|uniref:Protein transport protein sec16 n=1 Tax=Cylicocyclus nassatus TaxID=53992 RepID=A0AA36DLU9_CYLNA|nr:unnamed protein product [Cylicocyclus nassatus]
MYCKTDFRKTADKLNVAHSSSTNAEQSDCTSGYFSAETESERKNVRNCYKKFKENFSETIRRLNQYRTDTPPSKCKPSSGCAETLRRNDFNRTMMRPPGTRGRLSNSDMPCSKSGEGGDRESPLYFTYDSVPAMYGEEFVDAARSKLESSNLEHAASEGRAWQGNFPSARDSPTVAEEIYYLGAVHLDQVRVRSTLADYPPPPEFHLLPPVQKAAYVFYVTVYKRNYNDVSEFHRKFNREYFKYTCSGDSDVTALWKICKSIKDEYFMKMALESRATEDGHCQKPNYQIEEENAMNVQDSLGEICDSQTTHYPILEANQAPLKYRVAHAFVTFGYLGKMVTVNPCSSPFLVQIDDVKTILTDPHDRRLIHIAQIFRGPLIIDETPTHSVLLYIERQIKRISGCRCATDNSLSNEVADCALIWHLLRMLVQQQGRVTGPDLARLLLETKSTSSCGSTEGQHSRKEIRRNSNTGTHIFMASDTGGRECSMKLLLTGHINEAIDNAFKDELYADAMIIARHVLAHDPAKLVEIEERFLCTKRRGDPVVTLVSVARNKPLSYLTSSIVDLGCWREHVAIILANLSNQYALNYVYELGKLLAQRKHNCAADFCLLVIAILTEINSFNPFRENYDAGTSEHLRLIHSEPAYGRFENTQCRYGFSLSDFHATEIFDYAVRLSGDKPYSSLSESLEFQRIRIQYTQLITDFGGFANEAFRYCLEIASSIWGNNQLSVQELTDFCDLADRFKFAACASVDEMSSISSLRAMEQEGKQWQESEIVQSNSVATENACEADSNTQETVLAADNTLTNLLPESFTSQRFVTELDMAEPSGEQAQTQPLLCTGSLTPSRVVSSPLSESDASQQSYSMEDYLDEEYVTPSTSPIILPHQQSMNKSINSSEANSRSSSNQSAEDVSTMQPSTDLSLNYTHKQPHPTSLATGIEQTASHLKAIPSNEMILPDDREPAIVWDPAKGRYVDTDDTEEVTTASPTASPLMLDAQISNFGTSGLAAARKSGGSRYYNPWKKQSSVDDVISPPSVPVPAATLPPHFGFIPTTPDDAGELSAFSEQAP